jgi:uncharacterized membrane-anchored protein YhcB (DUF1043 family)
MQNISSAELRTKIAKLKARIEKCQKQGLKNHVISLTGRLRRLSNEYRRIYEYQCKGFNRVDNVATRLEIVLFEILRKF